MGQEDQCHILLAKRIADPVVENQIDRRMKRFLRNSWTLRACAAVSASVNSRGEDDRQSGREFTYFDEFNLITDIIGMGEVSRGTLSSRKESTIVYVH
jgi:hypothetical protein